MRRRTFLSALAALAAHAGMSPAAAGDGGPGPGLGLGPAQPFDPDLVVRRARARARATYRTRDEVPEAWQRLTYDQYRDIAFDAGNALWRDTATPLRIDVLPPGIVFRRPVTVHAVDDGQARPLLFDPAVFEPGPVLSGLPADGTLGYSGLRLRAELEHPDIYTEFAVFQGGSYFRGIGTGQIYGLSARGLAIATADPEGEEFPDFVEFWVERPAPGAAGTILHALLDSPSCTGAYTFRLQHGSVLTMDVSARLFARDGTDHLGLAPLTSMFFFDETNRDRVSDFRPAVHDSDGLMILNGAGEQIWRPLANPETLQISSFADTAPRGFGLMQRARQFEDFADFVSLYHRRPGLWVEPQGDWGAGAVVLVEIPTDREVYDNIVAYWRPDGGLKPGAELAMDYRLSWGADPAPDGGPARVLNTRIGGPPEEGIVIAIDFAPDPALDDGPGPVEPSVEVSSGAHSLAGLERNPATGGIRLALRYWPGDSSRAEFRVQLYRNGRPASEVWLYRWTR